jgi:ketosteroid isomerase-like protein
MDERDRLAALMGTMRQFAEALAAGDAATLGPLLSIGYKHTDRFGKLWFREEWLAQVRPQPKPPKAMDFGSFVALLHGDFGIVTGIKHLRVTGAREDEQETPTAYTQLWSWLDGRWLRVLFQETPIVDAT